MSAPSPSFAAWFWRTRTLPPVPVARDPRVDFFRGLALIVIFIDHTAGNLLSRITPAALGFSDAAEAFVLLAGFSTALAYGLAMDSRGLARGAVPIAQRVWKLYTAHLGLFLFMAVAVAAMAVKAGNPLYYEHVAILPFFQDPANAVILMATLQFLPNYLDILPLYIVLLSVLPLIWLAVRGAPVLALVLSGAIYVAGWQFELAFPNVPTGGVWFFNPFAWQLIFTVGVVAGHAVTRGVPLPRHPLLSLIALVIVGFGLVNAAPWTLIPGLQSLSLPDLWRIDADKTNLSMWRFTHSLALAYLIAAHVRPGARLFASPFGRAMVEAGRQSLPLFCLGVILSLVGTFAMFEIGRGWVMQVLVNVAGIGLLLLFARLLSLVKDVGDRRAVVRPSGEAQAR